MRDKWLLMLGGVALLAWWLKQEIDYVTSQVQKISQAIARAEGFGVPGALPTRSNNPGDLKLDGRAITEFATPEEGWAALYRQVSRILTGQSTYYQPSMTIREIAHVYTGEDNAESWAQNVAGFLSVSPDTPIGQVV